MIDFLQKTSSDKRLRDTLWVNMRHSCTEIGEEKVSDKEYTNIIDKAINQLPPQRKLIYRLSKEDGFNYQEFSVYLKNSGNRIRNYFDNIISLVRNFLK